MNEVIRILTVDEDALFDCSKESLDHFPRIRSVEDYKDSEYIKEQWKDYYDMYESAWELSILPNTPQIYFRIPFLLKPSGNIIRIECHDEILRFISNLFRYSFPSVKQLQIDNIDQHHDLYNMHGEKLDCSNWACPEFVQQAAPCVEQYTYNWFYTNLSNDYGFLSDCSLQGIKYKGYKKHIRHFVDEVAIHNRAYDMVVFCTSKAYVPKNYWKVFEGMYYSMDSFNSELKALNGFAKKGEKEK